MADTEAQLVDRYSGLISHPDTARLRDTLRAIPNNPPWGTSLADQIVMIAISVVYQALMRLQRPITFEPALRSMVRTIPPSWLVRDSSVPEEDVQIR